MCKMAFHLNTSVCIIVRNVFKIDVKHFRTTSPLSVLWEEHPQGIYRRDKVIPLRKRVKLLWKMFKEETLVFKQEIHDKIFKDRIMICRHGETDIFWKFDSPSKLKNWVASSDSDFEEGYSTASFTINEYNRGVFSGVLCTKIPVDGVIKRTGYGNIRCERAMKSFKRNSYWDWSDYNTLVLRIKGDGRTYGVNIATPGFYDISWNDMFSYYLHTRGGPYWQVTRIPFSKFLFCAKGRIQDQQFPLPKFLIGALGITIADKNDGPYRLEIDYIGLEVNDLNNEETAYEMYETAANICGH